jgi:hypothetical protein
LAEIFLIKHAYQSVQAGFTPLMGNAFHALHLVQLAILQVYAFPALLAPSLILEQTQLAV